MFHVKHCQGDQVDYETRLKAMTVLEFRDILQNSSRHEYGPTSINRRVNSFLEHNFARDQTMWDVVVDGPREWRMNYNCGPKIVAALAGAINTEFGAPIITIKIPAKKERSEGYFWTLARLKDASQMLADGLSYKAVADNYGKNVDGFKQALKRYNMYKPRLIAQWHSMKTAPMDGSLFLAYMGAGNMEIVRYDLERNEWWIDSYVLSNIEKNWMEAWMPLPVPPKRSA